MRWFYMRYVESKSLHVLIAILEYISFSCRLSIFKVVATEQGYFSSLWLTFLKPVFAVICTASTLLISSSLLDNTYKNNWVKQLPSSHRAIVEVPSLSLIIPLLFIIEGISSSGILVFKPCNFLCRKEGQTFLMQVISESFTSHSFHTPCHQSYSLEWGIPTVIPLGKGEETSLQLKQQIDCFIRISSLDI